MHFLFWFILITFVFGRLPNRDVKHFFESGIKLQNLHEQRLGDIPLNAEKKHHSEILPPEDIEVPVQNEDGHRDTCNEETNPCLCVDDGCGWHSELNKCINGSTTTCHECFTLNEECIQGVCQDWGCPQSYNNSLICQCTGGCIGYGNCCKDVTTADSCIAHQMTNIAKLAEDNALPIAIGGFIVIGIVGLAVAYWCSQKLSAESDDEDNAERLPPVRRFNTNRLISARSGPYSHIPRIIEGRSGARTIGDAEFANYARPLMLDRESETTNEHRPLMSGSGASHEKNYEATERVSLHLSPSDLGSNRMYSSPPSSMLVSPRACDLKSDNFVANSWEKIGSGNYGDVYSAKWFGATVAVKKGKGKHKVKDDMIAEAAQLRDLSHPSLCEFIGVVLLPREVWIITKFYEKGSVDKILKREIVTLKSKYKWCRQAIGGLAFLHSQKFVHRDLACRNLLVTKDYDCVIADFGLSRILKNNENRRRTKTNFGPVRWMALESFEQVYSTESDMWMFGVLVWEMLKDGQQPYKGLKNHQVVSQVTNGLRLPLDNEWPPSLNETLDLCWNSNPNQRPTATDMLLIFEELTGHTASPRHRRSTIMV